MTSRKRAAGGAPPEGTARAASKLHFAAPLQPLTSDNLSPPPSPSSNCGCQKLAGMDRIFVLSPTPTVVLGKDLDIIVVSNSWRKLANFEPDLRHGTSFPG